MLKDTFRELLNSSEQEIRDQAVQLVVLLKAVYKEQFVEDIIRNIKTSQLAKIAELSKEVEEPQLGD